MLKYLLILLLPFTLHAQDTTNAAAKWKKREVYVEDLSDMINISNFIARSNTGFTLSGLKSIEYSPNEGASLGVKFQHKWLGVALAYSPRKLQDEDIGRSDFINIVVNSYGTNLGFDVYYLTHRGFHVVNTAQLQKDKPPPPPDQNPHQYRYDLHTVNLGFNTYYLFNNKLSYRSTFLQNEWQKKSAGSFLLTAAVNYYKLSGDSTMVPVRYDDKADEQARLKSGEFYSFCLMPGYAHTFVIFKKLFITLAPSLGVMLQQQQYSTQNNLHVDRYDVQARGTMRAGFGFNSRWFYTGLYSIVDVYNYQLAKSYRISNQINSSCLYIGFRLGVPKPLKKYSDFLGRMNPVNLFSVELKNP